MRLMASCVQVLVTNQPLVVDDRTRMDNVIVVDVIFRCILLALSNGGDSLYSSGHSRKQDGEQSFDSLWP